VNGGRLIVEREHKAWADRARAYKVLVDGAEVGRVANGATETFELPPGQHVVQLKIDWCRSQAIPVQVPPGGEARVRCRGNASPFTILWYMTAKSNDYIGVEQVA
jgi:hypothetical protein